MEIYVINQQLTLQRHSFIPQTNPSFFLQHEFPSMIHEFQKLIPE